MILRNYLKNHALTLIRILFIAIAYFGTAKLGLSLNAVSGFAALIWPPAGIALAALLIFGLRVWPGIFIAAFFVNYHSGATEMAALGIGVGNTAEALLGYFILKKFGDFKLQMNSLKDGLAMLITSLVVPVISATVGVTSLLFFPSQPVLSAYETWNTWWIGDVLGILIITPFAVVWSKFSFKKIHFDMFRVFEGVIFILVFYLVSIMVFGQLGGVNLFWSHHSFWLFPLVVWCATRFGQLGTVNLVFTIAVIAIWKTAFVEEGPFVESSFHHNIFVLNCFLGAFSSTAYALAASISDRELAHAISEERGSLNSAFLTASLDAVIGANMRGEIIEFNPAAEKMFGFNKTEVVGKSLVNTFFPESFSNNIQKGIDNATATGKDRILGRRLEIPLVRANKLQFPAEISFTLGNAVNDQRSLIVCIRDISERIQRQRHENLLLQAGKILNSSLDYQTTLSQIAKLVIPDLADWCLIDVIENEKITRAVVSHKDHEKIDLLFELRKKFEPNFESPQPAVRALKSGQTHFVEEISDTDIKSMTRSEEHYHLMKKIGVISHIATPMISRGEIVGVLNLGLGPGQRKYNKTDVALAEEIASRAALAIDNARLFEGRRLKN